MAFFAATIEQIDKVWKHPDADRLDLGSVEGLAFQFCVGKDQYKPGDTVVYIPIDSELPETLIDSLGVRNLLSGIDQNRVKTVQLRGQISQGLVCKPESVLPEGMPVPPLKTDITALLGITKYEPPVISIPGGLLIPIPDGLGVYDIEGADRFRQVVDLLMDRPCYITEKVEGYNTALVRLLSGEIVTCQREYVIQMEDESVHNPYEKAFTLCGLRDTLINLSQDKENTLVALRGEALGPGICRNIYGLKDLTVRLFDIKIRERYLSPDEFEALVPSNLRVPVIAKGVTLREWLDGRDIRDASDGMSLLNPNTRREGIVIKPMVEELVDFGDGHLQRLIIKQRSPLYLAKEKV